MTARVGDDDDRLTACLIHAGAIGDFILALRVVASLRAHLQQRADQTPVEIHVLGNTATASLALGRAGVDSVTSLERLPLHTMFSDAGQVAYACVEYVGRFDVIANMYADAEAAFTRRLQEVAPGHIVTIDTTPRGTTRHVTEGWLDDLRAGGIAASGELPSLAFSDEEHRLGRRCLCGATASDAGPIVLIHPGSGGLGKCWPTSLFVELAHAIQQSGLWPVFMLGPVELERHGEGLIDRLSAAAPVLIESDLVRAAQAIVAAEVFVGNDCGMTHVAGAAGTSTVALFGPTDPVVWGPLGERVTVVRGTSPGTFDGVTVDRVCGAVVDACRS
jgi:ADP-heptose:LPS heptosyltransferase